MGNEEPNHSTPECIRGDQESLQVDEDFWGPIELNVGQTEYWDAIVRTTRKQEKTTLLLLRNKKNNKWYISDSREPDDAYDLGPYESLAAAKRIGQMLCTVGRGLK